MSLSSGFVGEAREAKLGNASHYKILKLLLAGASTLSGKRNLPVAQCILAAHQKLNINQMPRILIFKKPCRCIPVKRVSIKLVNSRWRLALYALCNTISAQYSSREYAIDHNILFFNEPGSEAIAQTLHHQSICINMHCVKIRPGLFEYMVYIAYY